MAVTQADIRQAIGEIKDTLHRLEGRLNVHDQKHIQLDKEHGEFANYLKQHEQRLSMVENLAAKNERETEKLTGTL